jgi:hypothetical protein
VINHKTWARHQHALLRVPLLSASWVEYAVLVVVVSTQLRPTVNEGRVPPPRRQPSPSSAHPAPSPPPWGQTEGGEQRGAEGTVRSY